MNNEKLQIMELLLENTSLTQREMAASTALSLGYINKCLKELKEGGLVENGGQTTRLTDAGLATLEQHRVDNAIILSAGLDSNFVPLIYSKHKSLIEVNGEPLIERQIRQLHEKGIRDITICVGYMKEQFEYLIDMFGVKLFPTRFFREKNNLSTLHQVSHLLGNTYILTCDKYMDENPYAAHDCEDWYGAVDVDSMANDWFLDVGAKRRISKIMIGYDKGTIMRGPAHFTREFSAAFKPYLEDYATNPTYDDSYWETILRDRLNDLPTLYAKQLDTLVLINDFETLREVDPSYREHSRDGIIECIAKVFDVAESEINIIGPIKKGITNTSFLFQIGDGIKYVFRKPGANTDIFIDRKAEYECYKVLEGSGLADEPVYFNPEDGVKITPYYENSRQLDENSIDDKAMLVSVLRKLHESGLEVSQSADMINYIYFYDDLFAKENISIGFKDYKEVHDAVVALWEEIDHKSVPRVLNHIDARYENFLVLPSGEARLLDWEYSGMCDPFADLALHCNFEGYDADEATELLAMYLQREPNRDEQLRLFIYYAFAGLWSAQWALYKEAYGDDLGGYTLHVYRNAKTFCKKAQELLAQG